MKWAAKTLECLKGFFRSSRGVRTGYWSFCSGKINTIIQDSTVFCFMYYFLFCRNAVSDAKDRSILFVMAAPKNGGQGFKRSAPEAQF